MQNATGKASPARTLNAESEGVVEAKKVENTYTGSGVAP
jgi:hypothetical protein